MNKIPVENKTAMPIYIAGLMVAPGEIRLFDPDQVPEHLRPAAEAPAEEAPPADPLAELQALSVKALIEKFPEISTENLEKLGELEQAAKDPRKTLLSAIAEELLTRAANADLKDKVAALPALSKEDLDAIWKAEAAKENVNGDYLSAIKSEAMARAIASLPTLTDDDLAESLKAQKAQGDNADQVFTTALEAEVEARAKK